LLAAAINGDGSGKNFEDGCFPPIGQSNGSATGDFVIFGPSKNKDSDLNSYNIEMTNIYPILTTAWKSTNASYQGSWSDVRLSCVNVQKVTAGSSPLAPINPNAAAAINVGYRIAITSMLIALWLV
jgi:hypothetical protein